MYLNRTPQVTFGSNPTHLHASSTPAKFCSSETHLHYLENHPTKGISIASAQYSCYKTSRQIRGNVLSQVGMDLIGPLPKTSRGNQYIVTLTDYFTKWAEAAPLPDKSAVGVARLIYSVSFYH